MLWTLWQYLEKTISCFNNNNKKNVPICKTRPIKIDLKKYSIVVLENLTELHAAIKNIWATEHKPGLTTHHQFPTTLIPSYLNGTKSQQPGLNIFSESIFSQEHVACNGTKLIPAHLSSLLGEG